MRARVVGVVLLYCSWWPLLAWIPADNPRRAHRSAPRFDGPSTAVHGALTAETRCRAVGHPARTDPTGASRSKPACTPARTVEVR